MAKVTLTVDDEVLRRARIRALEQGTSVNALVRAYLEAVAGGPTTGKAVVAFLERVDRAGASSADNGRRWVREDLYEDRLR